MGASESQAVTCWDEHFGCDETQEASLNQQLHPCHCKVQPNVSWNPQQRRVPFDVCLNKNVSLKSKKDLQLLWTLSIDDDEGEEFIFYLKIPRSPKFITINLNFGVSNSSGTSSGKMGKENAQGQKRIKKIFPSSFTFFQLRKIWSFHVLFAENGG